MIWHVVTHDYLRLPMISWDCPWLPGCTWYFLWLPVFPEITCGLTPAGEPQPFGFSLQQHSWLKCDIHCTWLRSKLLFSVHTCALIPCVLFSTCQLEHRSEWATSTSQQPPHWGSSTARAWLKWSCVWPVRVSRTETHCPNQTRAWC